jgi:hypothetical protein
VFPDTTEDLIERWEKVTRIASRPGDDIEVRRARVLAVLRRSSGPRLDQIRKMLAGPFDLDEDDIVFVEMLRSYIDEALTETTGTISVAVPTVSTGVKLTLGKPWPGVVDDYGVSVYLDIDNDTGLTVTLTSPSGTIWTVPVEDTTIWYSTRTDFLDETAGGHWVLKIYRAGGATTLREFRLLVSNDVDSGWIYNFYAQRDADLSGTPDLKEAQRQFHRMALAQMRAFVIERLAFIHGDEHSLHGREPHGA